MKRISLSNISNKKLSAIIIIVSVIFVLVFDKNLGYSSYVTLLNKIDTLKMECADLQKSITSDSIIIEGMKDSQFFEHYVREKYLYIGEGETMYIIDSSNVNRK